MKYILELTKPQKHQLIISLKNDWMDNDHISKAIIERILNKLGTSTKEVYYRK